MPRFVTRVTRHLEGRFAISAILGFCMFSATFALATAIGPTQRGLPSVAPVSPEAAYAELEVQELVDERIHLHLKRLHMLAPATSGSGIVAQ